MWLHAWAYLNNYSTVSTVSRYSVVIKQHNWEQYQKKVQKQERKIIKDEKQCRNGVPKSTQTRKYKSYGKNTKPLSYIFALL